MKKRTNTQKSPLGFCSGIVRWCMLLVVVLAGFATNVEAGTPTYPFPQNYKYPYGQIYTGSNVGTTIQGLFNAWKTTYYVAGTMTGGPKSGQPAARIKFQQPGQDGSATVSEGIGYGMLITVYMDNATNNTQDMFDRLWTYYLGNANGNGLMNWKVTGFTGQVAPGTGNANGATDADIDVANALLMAHKQWGSAGKVNYLSDAQKLINAIYTFEVDGNKLLKPGDAFNDYANPCYYITNSTTLFGKVEVDQKWQASDRWTAVNSACYTLMKASRNATTGLVPDWCQTPSGAAINGIISDKFESYFLYDAIRIPWRMAHAYAWYGHTDAKDVASKITTWVQGAYSDPATIWDGYNLNGTVFSSTNPTFSTLGKNHNPCFSGGLSVGATVDATFKNYMDKCWSEGSKVDNYGAYFTQTTQLLYMLFLTGNMPNFWDMKPVPVTAETNANGNVIYVDFSKAIASTTSTTGWTVQTFADETDATPTAITVSSISVLDKRVTVTLSTDISEQFIKISYNGTTIKSSADNLTADAFTNFVVTNKITNMEPFPSVRLTNTLGTQVKIQWSKAINPASISGGFSVKINGTQVTVGTPTIDPDDPSIINIPLTGTLVTSAADVITVSFTGGSITSTTSTKTAKAFTDLSVQNFYMNVTCYDITDFDSKLNVTFASWIAGVWSSAGTDPAGGTDKVGYFNGDNTTAYISTKATVSAANKAAFGAAFFTPGSRLKAKLYAKTGTFATGEQIKIVFAHAALADAGSYYDANQVQFLITPPSYGSWFDIDLPINGVVDNTYDFIQMTGSNVDKTGNKTNAEFYIDDMQICPAPPTVSYVTGRTSYDGGVLELRFSTAMKVPASASEISVDVDGLPATVSSITAKQGDATVLVLVLSKPISSPSAVVTVSGGSSAGLKSVDGRNAEYFYMSPVVNLVGISVTTGWRDNFNSSTDFVTANIGAGTAWKTPAPVETPTGDGVYKITGSGSAAWSSLDVTTWVDEANANKEVMDLSGREKVEIRYRIPAGNTSTTLKLRVDLKDKANGISSDAMAFIPLTISTTWVTKTIDVSPYFVKKIQEDGTPYPVPLTVDRSNIYQVMFYFIEKEGTAANNYVPTNFKGVIEFDYISIGSALVLTLPVTTINEGQSLTPTSSATGKVYLVPNNTPPVLTAIQDSVFAGRGKVIDVTANVAGTLATTGLKPGYYLAYAYDPSAGAISAKVGVQINDITKPIITAASSGNVSLTGTLTATVDEDAMLYLIPTTGVTLTSLSDIIDKSRYSLSVAKGVAASFLVADVNPALTIGGTYVFIAVDYATPNPNISAVSSPVITIANVPLTMSVVPTGAVQAGDNLTINVSRSATAYLIPSTVLVSTQAHLTANSVKTIAITGSSDVMSTNGVALGDYYIYVSDGTNIVGPSSKITISDTKAPTLSAITSGSVIVNTGTISATSDEAATLYVIKQADIAKISTAANLTTYAVTSKAMVAGVATSITASSPIVVGNYVLFAADAAGNIAGPTTLITVEIGCVGVTAIAVTPSSLSLIGGNSGNLTVSVSAPTNATAISGTDVTWTYAAADGNITLNGNNSTTTGLTCVIAASASLTVNTTATVKVSVKGCDGVTVTKDITITLTAPIICPSAISIAPSTQDIFVNGNATLTATLTGSLGSGVVSWVSSAPTNGKITASTSSSATVNGLVIGTTSITASVTCGGNTITSTPATVNIVKTPVSGVTITSITPLTITVGATSQASATVAPATATVTGITWSTEDASIATVSTTGLITASTIKTGTVNIVATSVDDPTKFAKIAVTVGAKPATAISLSPATLSVEKGSSKTTTVLFTPADATNKGVTISSNAAVTATYDIATNVITVTGNTVTTTPVTLTITSADGPTTTLTVNVTCPTAVPTASQVSNVTTCAASPAALIATFTSGTAQAVWYSAATGGTALFTGNTYAHGKTAVGAYTYYVAQSDNGCESATRLAVSLTITANPVVAISTPTDKAAYCITDNTAYNLAATPTGGTFKIDGTTVTKLNPSSLTAGAHTVTYDVTSGGCSGSGSASITIDAAPAITLGAIPTVACSADATIALSATPTGGTWSGAAVTGSSFNPATATVGANLVTYTLNSGSCVVTKDATISVTKNPAPAFSGLPASVCKGSAALTLSGYVNIAGGTFSDNLSNVAAGVFTPTNAGTSTITYSVTSNGCIGTKTANIVVNALPTIAVTPIGTICTNSASQTLQATPTGGIWSGSTAISGGKFDPSLVSAGVYSIKYSYTDVNGCVASSSIDVTVNTAPIPSAQNASVQVNGTPAAINATATGTVTWYQADKTTVIKTGSSYTPTDATTVEGTVYTYYISNTVNGCESEKVAVTLTVTSCTTPAPTNPSVLTVCQGQITPQLTATGTSLKWYTADGVTELAQGPFYTPTVTSVGTHTFKVSQTSGCEGTKATASLTIESKPASLTVAAKEVCEGSANVALTATGTGVTWFDNSKVKIVTSPSYTPTVTAAKAYTFYVSQTVGNCASDSVPVTYTILAKPSAPITSDIAYCIDKTPFVVTAQGSNISWYDDKDAPIGTGASITPTTINAAGVYTFKATQTTGNCVSDKATVKVTINDLPAVTLSGSATMCSNDAPVTLNASPSGGTFSGIGVNATTGLFNPSTGSSSIKYSVTDVKGCSNSKTLAITVGSATVPVATGSSCLVGAASIPPLTATGSGTIYWYSSETATTELATGTSYVPTVATTSAQTITYYVANKVGDCYSERVQAILTISSCTTTAPAVKASIICEGDASVALSATGSGIKWYDDKGEVGTGSTYVPTVTAPGVYTFYASQTITCEGPKEPVSFTINPKPSISFDAITAMCYNDAPLSLNATPNGGSFTGNGVVNGKFTPTQALAGDNTITYSYTDAKGCVNKATQTAKVTYVAAPVVKTTPIITQVNVTPAAFEATGAGILWYADAGLTNSVGSGNTYQASAKASVGNTSFYLTQTVSGCTSQAAEAVLSVTNCSTPVPTVVAASSCVGQTIKAITATGTGLKWYSDVDLLNPITVAVPTSFIPNVDNSKASITTFYVTQTNGCEGPAASVTYTINALPVVSFDAVADVCSDVTTPVSFVVNPTGGVFKGDITTSSFTPSVVGVGLKAVTYEVTNSTTGCINSASQTVNIKNCAAPLVQSITIPATLTVNVGATSKLSVLQVTPSGASSVVQWVVTHADTANVANDGTVTGVGAGVTTIKAVATDGSKIESNTCTVTVLASHKPVSTVTFNNTAAIKVSETGTVDLSKYLVINPSDATIKSKVWASLDANIASIDPATGIVSGKPVTADQQVNITVTVTGTDGGVVVGNIAITVTKNAILVSDIVIPSTLSLEPGKKAILAVTSITNNADDKTVTWSVSSGSAGTVDPVTGEVTAIGAVGSSFSIVATANDAGKKVSNVCVVTINDVKLQDITFSKTVTTCQYPGTVDLSQLIVFSPADAADKSVSWTIDDATQRTYADVNILTGILTSKTGSGTVVVKATNVATGLSATISVTMSTVIIPVTGVSINPPVTTLKFNQNKNSEIVSLTAIVAPTYATEKSVTWQLAKPTTGVSIDQQGNVTITDMYSDGSVTVNVITTDGAKTASATINYTFAYTVESVKISTLPTSINRGEKLQIQGQSLPIATKKTIVWSIDPTSTSLGASISSTGELTAGTTDGNIIVIATVTDTDGSVFIDKLEITVKTVVNITGIVVNGGNATLNLNKGDNQKITVSYLPIETEQTGVTYTSSDPCVSVDGNGNVIANYGGQATITVTPTANVSLKQTIVVNVKENVSSIKLSNANPSINIGGSTTVIATIGAATANNQLIDVTSSDPTIATITMLTNTEYKVVGIAEGDVTINAVAQDGSGVSTSIDIKVNKIAISNIKIAKTATSIEVGSTATLIATIDPSNASYKDVEWFSSNPSVLKISTTGVITGVAVGTSTIKVTSKDDSNKFDEIVITVTKKALNLVALNASYDEGAVLLSKSDRTVIKKDIYNNLYAQLVLAQEVLNADQNATDMTQTYVDSVNTVLRLAIEQVKCNCYLSIDAEEIASEVMVVYPNPVVDVLTIDGLSVVSVKVIDLYGKVVAVSSVNEVNLSGVTTGVYTVIVTTKNGVKAEKIVKE